MATESELRRLALIRFMYGTATQQADQPQPLAGLAILTLHDAAEFFLQLVSEHMEESVATPSQMPGLTKYYPKLKTKIPELTPYNDRIVKLNTARGALKHTGLMPEKGSVQDFRDSMGRFFEEITPCVFGVEFDKVSLVSLVAFEMARNHLEAAEESLANGDRFWAIRQIDEAFNHLVGAYNTRQHGPTSQIERIMLQQAPVSPSAIRRLHPTNEGDREIIATFGPLIEHLLRAVREIRDETEILRLGLDLRRYEKFRSYIYQAGIPIPDTWPPGARDWTDDECRFCIDFVVNSAFGLQEDLAAAGISASSTN